MPTQNEIAAAVEAQDADLMKAALVRRVGYCIAEDEDPQDFVALDSGAVCLYLIYKGLLFELDADDSVTPHDGVSVIVTSDGYRYKTGDINYPYSILSVEENDPPGSPNIGDALHIGSAPSGDWVGHANEIAVYSRRGWVFFVPPEGRLFFCESDGKHYYMDGNGDFISGIKNFAADNTIPDAAVIGWTFGRQVESQTVNDPPSSPGLGVYWIIGGAPTGDWSGHSGKVATSYDGSTWTIIDPLDGFMAFDKAVGANFIYRTGKGWVFAGGAWSQVADVFTAGTGSTSTPVAASGPSYSYSDTVAPTTSQYRRVDNVAIEHAAAAAGTRKLRFDFSVRFTRTADSNAGGNAATVALFRDNESSAIAWMQGSTVSVNNTSDFESVAGFFLVDAPDAASHTYKLAVMGRTGTATQLVSITSLSRRSFQLMEKF